MSVRVRCQVNGKDVDRAVADDQLLCDFLREDLHLFGTRIGCNEGVCGACNVLLGVDCVRSCLLLAAQIDRQSVVTVEGLAREGELSPVQRALIEHGALQCGFCTAGVAIAATSLLLRDPSPTRDEIVAALDGNICRCTGYQPIIDAIATAAATEISGE